MNRNDLTTWTTEEVTERFEYGKRLRDSSGPVNQNTGQILMKSAAKELMRRALEA